MSKKGLVHFSGENPAATGIDARVRDRGLLSIVRSLKHQCTQSFTAHANPSAPWPTSISLSTFQVFKLMTAIFPLESQET